MSGVQSENKRRRSRSMYFTRVAMIIRILAGWDGARHHPARLRRATVLQIGAAITPLMTALQ
jgi:hypothetical protein